MTKKKFMGGPIKGSCGRPKGYLLKHIKSGVWTHVIIRTGLHWQDKHLSDEMARAMYNADMDALKAMNPIEYMSVEDAAQKLNEMRKQHGPVEPMTMEEFYEKYR